MGPTDAVEGDPPNYLTVNEDDARQGLTALMPVQKGSHFVHLATDREI